MTRRWLTPEAVVAHQTRHGRSRPTAEVVDTRAPARFAHERWKATEAVRSTPPPIYPLVGLARAAGLPQVLPEYTWHPTRKYRADYAMPMHRVLIEVDGGLFVNGGHSRGAARLHDMAKDRAATLLGWRTLRYAPEEFDSIVADLLQLVGRSV
jgi:hypothetical protein